MGEKVLGRNKRKRGKWQVKMGKREERILQGKGSVGGMIEKR